MSVKQFELSSIESKSNKKFNWYWSLIFCAIWYALFYIAVIPSYYSYPDILYKHNEQHHIDKFIGERAREQLFELASIGTKLTGSIGNEVHAVNFLLREVHKIKAQARLDLYDIDIDVQHSSGKFALWGMATSYDNITNVVVKLAPKQTNSTSYLLINSHFDSEVGTSGAADAGVMIVIMLETMRVISKSTNQLKNPIIFLFNGAEEANLLAAHGFISQHKWAPFCNAVINLDSAGSGGREVLFQTGPNHPWLVKYYKQSVPHPYASTVAEELFQNNFIPSDTDFRIFRDYGGLPGLDMAHCLNGYVYHTKYDSFNVLERGTYQTTGDNVLALTWALANAPELENPKAHAEGHTIFYDYLGWFMISYTESTGIIINITISVAAFIVIAISIFCMTREKSADAPKQIYIRFLWIFFIQFLSIILSFGVGILNGFIMTLLHCTESWYYAKWLLFGQHFCNAFCCMVFLPVYFLNFTAKKTHMRINDSIACFTHAHCLVLSIICITMTVIGIRSAFFIMIAILFYTISVIFQLFTRYTLRKCYFLPIHLICQLLPFWFYTYLTYGFLTILIPMQGRDGPNSNPELLIAVFCALMTTLFFGFIIPVFLKFRKARTQINGLIVIIYIFFIIAFTPPGFPYKADVAPQRFYVLHTDRIIRNFDGQVVKNESGFYIQPVDTRINTLTDTTFKDALPKSWLKEECETELLCGLPLYNSRWLEWKNSARWIPAETPILPKPTELKLISKVALNDRHLNFTFDLISASHTVIYINPTENTKINDWSFDRTPLLENSTTPYFAYHVYSMVNRPLRFWLEIEKENVTNNDRNFHLGIGAHFLHHTKYYTKEYQNFLNTFPKWAYATNWLSTYNSWIF